MRAKHGLHAERVTLLASAGGFGVGAVEHMFEALCALRHPAQLVAVCGRNEELRARLARKVAKLAPDGQLAVKVIGYTTEMDELMAAADILIGKPGGLTMSEALARGLLIVVVNPIPVQEERNSDHLLEEGVALRANNLPALAYKLDHLLDDPARLDAMQKNVRRLARPRAAYEIVNKLLTLSGNAPAALS